MDSGRAGTTDFETTVFLGYFKDMPDHRQPGLRHVIRPRGTRPPQVLMAQGAKGHSRQAGPSGLV